MKKKVTIFLIAFFAIIKLQAQDSDSEKSKYQFARKVFRKEYKKEKFNRFSGVVTIINEHTWKFDEKVLTIGDISEEHKLIFTKGIFYPNIITGNSVAEIKTQEKLSAMSVSEKVFYNMGRTDSLYIGHFEELEKLNNGPKSKRFVFWLYSKGSMNPTECYIELINENANSGTSFNEFIENARLSFYRKGTVIL